MKTMITFCGALVLFCLFSCNKEQALLNDVEGRWEVASVDYLTDDGSMLVVDANNVTLDFRACDPDLSANGDCALSLTLPDGETVLLNYNVLNFETQNLPTLQISGSETTPITFDTSALGQVLLGSFGHEVNGDLLEAVDSRNGATFSVTGQRIVEGRFTLRR